ncbi:conserved hypothetical protein, membrane [methanotrophic bacterial endosymbiont of Bathymodiolus sp.]|jgi:predicted membrane-bound spermidine synthase|nr:conserved hypothetical protein, membrane [methanotrophic bacterial endosymbiont of Bathymodiolus sp.]
MKDNKSVTFFEGIGLYVTVFITGASVMVIELLDTRMNVPFYGASIYVWSSLISVTLIALSLGYFVGDRWADSPKKGRGVAYYCTRCFVDLVNSVGHPPHIISN